MTHLESLRNMLDEANIAYEYGEDEDAGWFWVRIEENGHGATPLNSGGFFTVFTFSVEGKLSRVGIWE
jgi:hypothetical protein